MMFFGDDDNMQSLSSQFMALDKQRARMEAIIRQTDTLCSLGEARKMTVLNRLGLSTHQPIQSPHPPAFHKQRLGSAACRRRLKPLPVIPTLTQEPKGRMWIKIQQSRIDSVDEDRDKLELPRNQNVSPSFSVSSSYTLSSVDAETPEELRAIPLICSPDKMPLIPAPFLPSPRPPPPKRRASRIPVLVVKPTGEALKAEMEAVEKRQKRLKRNSVAPLPQRPEAPKKSPAVAAISRAPALKPSPPTTGQPRKTKIRTTKMKRVLTLNTAEIKDQEKLQPLINPAASLSQCFMLLASDDWKKKVEGLRCVRALVQHHPDVLMVKLHEVCLVVMEEVKNLRSCVACAAIDTFASLYANLQKDMDNEAERTGRILLLRIAQASANTFVQQQVNVALAALVQNCSPGRVLTLLLNTGLCHLSPAVRTSTAQQLQRLADRLGAAAVLRSGQSFTLRFLIALSKISLDAAAEVRAHGRAIIETLAQHRDFMQLWQQTIPLNEQISLEKIVQNAAKK